MTDFENSYNQVNINNIKYFITNKDDIIQKTLLQGNQWNNEIVNVINIFVKQYNLKHFLNIGSHIGTVCLPISKNIEKVTAIEAYDSTYEHLLKNVKLNDITNIETFNIAIGDKKEEVNFFKNTDDRLINNMGGMHVITEIDKQFNLRSAKLVDNEKKCLMYPLDEIDEIDNFDIVLVDIEGMDARFLFGAKNKILKNKPIIIIEIWDDNKRKLENMKVSRNYVINLVINLGYALYKQIDDDFIFLPNKYL